MSYELGGLKFTATGDRIIALEDEFRSGYECEVCKGSGKSGCADCNGTGRSQRVPSARCSTCTGEGAVTCPSCSGKGITQGGLVIPEAHQRRPTTGKIVSAGPDCKVIKEGDSVMYSNFAGHVIELARAGKTVTLRILHETEILCLIEGHLELRDLRDRKDMTVTT